MCGIIGYIGRKNPASVVTDGLKTLEYRGYDSAGVAFWDDNKIKVIKTAGRVEELVNLINGENPQNGIAMGHTRWATHGEPDDINAHPHSDCSGNMVIVHNGVIENYRELKKLLTEKGHDFKSETDTEIIAHLIEHERRNNDLSIDKAVSKIIPKIKGTYGLVIMSKDDPDTMIAVRNFSPLILGLGNGEFIIASDASAILKHTNQVVYLNDGEMAVINKSDYRIMNIENKVVSHKIEEVDSPIEELQKGNYAHFTLKEIMEQPESLRDPLRGRLIIEDGMAQLGGLANVKDRLRATKNLTITGCGTAYLAGVVGKYMIEEYAGLKTEVDLASEFRYRKPIIGEDCAILAISQSGETADTIAALKEAKEKGAMTLGVVNTVGSTIARMTDAGVYNHAGPEIGVASTKAFSSQVITLALYTLFLGRQREMSLTMGKRIASELNKIPNLVSDILQNAEEVKRVAEKYIPYRNFLFIGRKYNYAVAYEGALKLKEISYVHAEGYGSGEMKHGPLAMIDENFPTIAIVPSDSVYEKNISNIQEIRARKGPVIAIATEGNEEIKGMVDDVIYIPKTLEMLTPLLTVVPLQLFAYYSGVLRGLDVDKPRNLAKSVTVE